MYAPLWKFLYKKPSYFKIMKISLKSFFLFIVFNYWENLKYYYETKHRIVFSFHLYISTTYLKSEQPLQRLQLMRFRKHLIIYVFLARRRRNLFTLREIGDVQDIFYITQRPPSRHRSIAWINDRSHSTYRRPSLERTSHATKC